MTTEPRSPDEATDELPDASDAIAALPDRAMAFYSALLTEHFVLESARGITVNESSSRSSLYLMTLSSALVAFGFLARTNFAVEFLAVIIPVIFLLGIFTYERLVETSLEDVVALASIQRIRGAYAKTVPGAEAYFPMPAGPHAPNEMLPIGRRASWRGVFFTMSSAIGVVNSIVGGAGVAILCSRLGLDATGDFALGGAVAVILATIHGVYQEHRYSLLRRLTTSTAPESSGG